MITLRLFTMHRFYNHMYTCTSTSMLHTLHYHISANHIYEYIEHIRVHIYTTSIDKYTNSRVNYIGNICTVVVSIHGYTSNCIVIRDWHICILMSPCIQSYIYLYTSSHYSTAPLVNCTLHLLKPLASYWNRKWLLISISLIIHTITSCSLADCVSRALCVTPLRRL